jgi:hypothetical protein
LHRVVGSFEALLTLNESNKLHVDLKVGGGDLSLDELKEFYKLQFLATDSLPSWTPLIV